MSRSPTPKGTPTQHSPVDGECPEGEMTPGGLKKRVSSLLQSPSFREELDVLIQEQMKKGGSSSNLWALRQIADFMATHGSPAALPVTQPTFSMVTPINDLQGWEPASMAKGEKMMRCKLASVHRLMDLYGWAQLANTCLTVSAMKCGLLPLSHEALLVGDVAYYDYNGVMEEEEDRVELQKSLVDGDMPVLVLRNHGIVALGETVEEAFYTIYHIQTACQIQVAAMCSAGGEQNLILLDRSVHRPASRGTVGWAGSTFGPMHKSRLGEHEFEALMRTLDNLGYRTGYAYRFPVLLERSRTRREVEVPATATSLAFYEDGVPSQSRLLPHAQRQQQRTRWLNTPNLYQKINQDQASPGHRTMWQKSEEITQGGRAIKIENPNQFVPLFTNPKEVLETRNKIREQNRQDMKTAGPQSQVLASVITDNSPPSPEALEPPATPEPEMPNPFNELTDQELEEYRKEVHRKQQGLPDGVEEELNDTPVPSDGTPAVENDKGEEKEEELEKQMKALSTNDTTETTPSAPPTAPPNKPAGNTPEGSPSKSPSKKKKKFKAPCFLKKSKKQKEKAEA
ncbi:hypothetical protein DNTS_021502 [Danionella cerebrum]|uniref:Class II aldolase/adducin N-terminal domain-containing protein n=1 Tax=Danionella cerebrum TaxID=2873325 RepID=A0A553R3Z9_9TELE|nr:hypothetical protein DNTS_021502 [Danionella translucida]TRY96902.1 hypothetical protein DNTS_021502 [Danionella translucida]